MTRKMPADPDSNISGYWPEEARGFCGDCRHVVLLGSSKLCCWEHDTGEGAQLHPTPVEDTCEEWERGETGWIPTTGR